MTGIYATRPKGAVLLLVLGAIALLSILAVELSHRSNIDVMRAARSRRAGVIRRAFDSGTQIAKGLLIEGRTSDGFDYWGDAWSKTLQVELENGIHISIQVSDESGKLNIVDQTSTDPSTTPKALSRIFNYLRHAEPDRAEQWRDAEKAVISRLGNGKKGPSIPLYTLDGLREAGIPLDLVFGNGTGQHLTLSDFLTVFGDGHININTASNGVLLSLDDEYDSAITENINKWRGGTIDSEAKKYTPFKTTKDLELVDGIVVKGSNGQISKNLLLKVQDRITVKSTAFSSRIRVEFEGRAHEGWAFFEATSSTTGQQASARSVKMLAFEEIEP